MTNEFNQFNLHPQLVQAVSELGYTAPTSIQEAVIPLLLSGEDVIGQAQTGTGKTAAFALPILHTLPLDQRNVGALVIAPTRELAMQVAHAFHELGQLQNVRVLAIYGGQPYGRQIGRLNKGVDVVVGTPGRLLDLLKKRALDLSQVQTVILDEADEMLSMGFIEDIEAILTETPPARQTALFSATMPQGIRRLAQNYMHSPQQISIERKQLTVESIEQRYYLVNPQDKLAALTRLFEVEPISSALIFAQTRVGTGELANELTVRGFPAEALSGDLNQDARIRVLNRFRHRQIKVLVATDVAARGLDIDDISHVFNFDLPLDPEVYVHRIGRTGRVGKSGIAISLVTPREQSLLRRIERLTRKKITSATLPTVEDIKELRDKQLVEQMMVWLRRGRCLREREMVDELITAGQDPLDIAASALKIARAEEKQRPIAPIGEVSAERRNGNRSKSRTNGRSRQNGRSRENGRSRSNGYRRNGHAHEPGMVRLSLSKGKANGIRPNDVVGTLAHHAKIPGNTIGKIQIHEQHTLVDVPDNLVPQVLAKSGTFKIHREIIAIERA